jgi:acyl carrier protein
VTLPSSIARQTTEEPTASIAGIAAGQTEMEQELARLIVTTLQLEITSEQIVATEPMFREGLGLDSIDALELSLAVSTEYGVELKADDERNGEIFASLRSLARHVTERRTR